ncbi:MULTISPECIES: ABC transporter permease [Acinetobacter]|jgi:microcin C transport system permease protein|uniref:ABC transporter permease n=1 Tax=Acinetobacter TaxID=469 RepID=UPI0002AEA341|nr:MULTISPECIES: ABC transporter permease [Acinetobacter]ELW79796.1 ABC transporter, permease protein [Acinetobacter sp. WC-743]MBI0395287.1 ABC transporter permease [Acinetobacter bereziniae]MBJ8425981.1 ABC transporter permease [Acinetobacter bereziniae]MBJ8474183.1 ABC transporter permease [Acinetobacter bereziniae]MDR3027322.1 ABC transporter permease [Acinetobacter sp.]
MSPIMHARLEKFKQNRLGFGCFILFMALFVISISAEFIANDKPVLVKYDQHYYMPVFKAYPETTFGGVFETEADYRDPVVQQLIDEKGWAIWPILRFSYQTPNLDLAVPVPSPPTAQNWLGTDDQGRDVLARILYGLRLSLLFGFALTLFAAFLGVVVGAIQGYYGGWIDLIGQRILEVWGGLPTLFMVIILVSLFTPSVYWLFLIMLIFGWTELVGIVRAEFLRARHLDYVQAARALGVSDLVIIFRHILPNVMSSSLSQLPFMLTANITALTALDFLGYGLPPDAASLGELLLQGKNNLDAPWLALSGFFTLALVLSLLIYIGEATRDAFDPRRQK